jgi:hypothetical protein
LLWVTLAVIWIGLASSLHAWLRGGAAAGGFAALFALAALQQGTQLFSDETWPLPSDPASVGSLALFGACLAGLVALRALRRATRERDRVEDLHWDSMELVRGVHELAARRDASLDDELGRGLELGIRRFRLDHAIACRVGEHGFEVVAWRGPEAGPGAADLADALAPRLRRAAACAGSLALERDPDDLAPPALGAFLGARVPTQAGEPCVLAFAGHRAADQRFTATDKDLIGLLADWLRGALELRANAEPAPRLQATRRTPAPPRRERRDLNHAVRRVEARLRSQLGPGAALEIALEDPLPALAPQRIPLEALVESLVAAAQRIACAGSLTIETGQLTANGAATDVEAHATLGVRVTDAGIDAQAATRAFDAPAASQALDAARCGALPLPQVERLLRRAGGDLALQVEPGRGALLTAFLPGRRAASRGAQPVRDAAAAGARTWS